MHLQSEDILHQCPKCNSKIFDEIWQIHKLRCNKNQKQSKPNRFVSLLYPQVSRIKKQEQDSQIIPCTQCGQNVPFCVYADHQVQCPGKQVTQCIYCDIKFPNFLIDEHTQLCQAKKQLQALSLEDIRQQQQKYNEEQNQTHQQQIEQQNQEIYPNLHMLISTLAVQKQKQPQEGLTKQQINSLRDCPYIRQEQCAICCTKMKRMQRNIKLNCKHIFHRQCITPWLSQNPHCPMCRRHALGK